MNTKTKLTPLALMALAMGACDSSDSPVGPDLPADTQTTAAFSVPISIQELGETTASGPVRVEVKLLSPTPPLVAREVEVEEPDDVFDEEKIESRVTDVSGPADAMVLTLELGGLLVDVSPGASFRDEHNGSGLDAATFLARLEDALAAGRRPAVEVKRSAPPEPQAPADPTFVATKVRLNDESSEPEIEMNVDSDNLEAVSDGLAVLTMLGLAIEVDVAGGRTEVERETDEARGEVDFEGLVRDVDLAARTVTLHTGTVIRIVDGTRIDQDSGNDDRRLRSLEAVASALAADELVEAEGEGVVETAGVIVAVEVEFEVENDSDDVPGAAEFEGRVTAADPAAGTLTLSGGLVIRITDRTVFDRDGDLFDLTSTQAAVDAGLPVKAEGDAVGATDGSGGLEALEVKIEVND